MFRDYDPRVKILIVMILTGVVVFDNNLVTQGLIVFLTFILAFIVGVNVINTLYKMRRFLTLLFSIIIIQSLFVQGGHRYLYIGAITLISEKGITLGIAYVFRVIVIIMSGAIISTSSMRNTMQGMVQLKLPYELALMTSIGVRFLPILMGEVRNTHVSMELRGIDVNELHIKRRLELIGRLFVPIVYSTLYRAKSLSESIDMRGYIIGEKRSSYYHLTLRKHDIALGVIVIIVALVILNRNYGGFI